MTSLPKRVLMNADTVGGVWTYAMELNRALGGQGVEIALATMGAPLSRSQRGNAGEWLLKLEDEFRPNIVHSNRFSHGALPWRGPKIVVGYSCVLSWWRAVKRCDAPPEWDTYHVRVLEGMALADLVVGPSNAMLKVLEEHYGPFDASRVIPNGPWFLRSRPRRKRDFILGAGRLWDEAKNVQALAKCARDLSWPVYVAGENRDPSGRELHHSYVRYLGLLPQSELQSWFEEAAIFAAPARYEPFGLSILEAALSGCALVLGEIPSLRENWNDATLFVFEEDTDALNAALRKLIENPNLRQELPAKAQGVASPFTPERMSEEYLCAYSEVRRSRDGAPRALPVYVDKKESFSRGNSCVL